MSGYLNNFVEYVRNLFKKGSHANRGDVPVCGTPPRRSISVIEDRKIKESISKHTANMDIWSSPEVKPRMPKSHPSADGQCSSRFLSSSIAVGKPQAQSGIERKRTYEIDDRTQNDHRNPDYDCYLFHGGGDSGIENRRIKESIPEQTAVKEIWTAEVKPRKPAGNSRCPSRILLSPVAVGKPQAQSSTSRNRTYEIDDRSENDRRNPEHDCCIFYEGYSRDFPRFRISSQRPTPSRERYHGLRRSHSSLELRPTLQNRNRIPTGKRHQKRPHTAPEENLYDVRRLSDHPIDCVQRRKLINAIPREEPEGHRHRPKSSRIPVSVWKHRKAGDLTDVDKFMCACDKAILSSPRQRSWKFEGHAIYCPRATVAYRSYLNSRLERMFRMISKKKYCGNIIDAASHSRWMKLAGIRDEDATCFKKFAKGRVVLPVSDYKSALLYMSQQYNFDYWDVLRKMTSIEISSGDSNSTISEWRGSR